MLFSLRVECHLRYVYLLRGSLWFLFRQSSAVGLMVDTRALNQQVRIQLCERLAVCSVCVVLCTLRCAGEARVNCGRVTHTHTHRPEIATAPMGRAGGINVTASTVGRWGVAPHTTTHSSLRAAARSLSLIEHLAAKGRTNTRENKQRETHYLLSRWPSYIHSIYTVEHCRSYTMLCADKTLLLVQYVNSRI